MSPSPSPVRGRRSTDLGLRALGVVLLICCVLGAWVLLAIVPPAGEPPGAIVLLLAAASFVCFSTGAALTALGRDVFAVIAVAGEEQRPSQAEPPPPCPPGARPTPRLDAGTDPFLFEADRETMAQFRAGHRRA